MDVSLKCRPITGTRVAAGLRGRTARAIALLLIANIKFSALLELKGKSLRKKRRKKYQFPPPELEIDILNPGYWVQA